MANPVNPALDPSLYLSNQPKKERQTGNSSLGKDDFLRLLITQLQNQDPMSPMNDREFIAQMAQFTAVEQLTNMNQTLQQFIQFEASNPLIKYSGLIGKEIGYEQMVDSSEQEGTKVTEKGSGVVKSISVKDTGIFAILEDGKEINVNDILQVSSITQK